MSDKLPHYLWSDLPGIPYKANGRTLEGLDCYGLVLLLSQRRGITIPDPLSGNLDSFLGGWEPVPERAPGDMLYQAASPAGPHVGIYLGADRWIHAISCGPGVAITRADPGLPAYRWAGKTFRGFPVLSEAPIGSRAVLLDMTGKREILDVGPDWAPPEGFRLLYGETGQGKTAVYGQIPGDPGTLTAIGIGLSLLGSLVQLIFAPPLPKDQAQEPGNPAFDLSGLSNTTGIGNVQPVVYGEHRVAGHIISAFQRPDESNRSVLYLLLLISRGEIESIGGLTTDQDDLTGSAIPDSIEIDGNPASSYNCSVSIRLGSQDQEPIPGFRETVTTTPYAVTLLPAQPFTHEPTVKIDGFEILLTFPVGLYDYSPQGNLQGRTVTFTVRHRVKNGPTAGWVTNTWLVFRETAAQTNALFRVSGLTPDEYEIQIERISPAWPETATDKESQSVLAEIHELAMDGLSYPGKALLAIKAIATDQLAGAVPNVTSIVKGRKVWTWNGTTWTEQWSQSPPWIVLDILLHPLYGLGKTGRYTLDNIDLPAFLAWANKCAELVSDGRGGTVPRALCDLNVASLENAWELCNAIAASSWAKLTMNGDKISVVVLENAAAQYPFAMGNVKDAQILYSGERSRPNAVEVQYLNAETNYEADYALKVTDTSEIRKETLQAVGVTRAAQAYRLAQFRLNFHTLSKKRISFGAGKESLHLIPGDPISFSHKSIGGGVSGRVLSATASTVVLDSSLDASSGTHQIVVRTKTTGADVLQTRTLTAGNYARGDSITVTSNWNVSDVPVLGDPYIAGPSATYLATYQIDQIETEPSFERRISAYLVDSDIYDDDPGDVEEFTDIMPSPKALPDAVENIAVRELHVLGADGGLKDALLVSWETTERWQGADVWYADRTDASTPAVWHYVGRAWHGAIEIHGVAGGASYQISVVPLAPRGTNRGPDFGSKIFAYVRGWRYTPDGPMSATAQVFRGMLTLNMMKPDDPAVIGFEVWWGLYRLAKCAPCTLTIPCPFIGTETIAIRTITRHGKRSWDKVEVSVTNAVDEHAQTIDINEDEHSGWPGSMVDTVEDAGVIVLDGTALSGTYDSPAHVPYLDGFRHTLLLQPKATLQDVALTWENAAFRWGDPQSDQTWANGVLTGFEVGEHLRWQDADFAWDSLPAQCSTWAGPIDALSEMAIDIYSDTGSGFEDYQGPTTSALSEAAGRITLKRPHEDYVPQLEEFTIQTAIDGGSEPERFSLEFILTNATAANANAQGAISSSSQSASLEVPTGKILTVLSAQGTFTSGASAGTTTVDVIVRNITDTSNVVVATGSTSSTNTRFHAQAEGSRTAPLGTLAAGKVYLIGWLNRASSPGALNNTVHHVQLTCIYEDA